MSQKGLGIYMMLYITRSLFFTFELYITFKYLIAHRESFPRIRH